MPNSIAVSRAPDSTTSAARAFGVVNAFLERDPTGEIITAVRRFPAKQAQWAEFPGWTHADLVTAYAAKGIRRPYSHQAEAAEAVHAGKNVVIVTPTASGKTLCYNLPILNAILDDSDTRALYLFPTKALAQDQLAELHDVNHRLDNRFGVFTYDGDTPSDARKAIREKGQLVLSNPDMLHSGILPHHTRWARYFESLRYIVIDELHSFLGSERGAQLQSLLHRVELAIRRRVPRIGLSATLGDMAAAAEFLRPGQRALGGLAHRGDHTRRGGQGPRQ